MTDEEVVLFVTNGDGTVDCSWCHKTFNADLAVSDGDDEPICPKCAEEENALGDGEPIEHEWGFNCSACGKDHF